MRARSPTEGKKRVGRAAGLLSELRRVVLEPGIAISLSVGLALVLSGTDPVVAVGASMLGIIAGKAIQLVLLLIGMSFSANATGYGRAMGLSDNDAPSRGYEMVGWMFVVVPPVVALGATILSARLLADVSRELIAVVVLGSGALVLVRGLVDARTRSRHEARARAVWLGDRDASAAGDPELFERLPQEGWRPDGQYDEMRAAYFRAVEAVKRERRTRGRSIWTADADDVGQPDSTRDDV